MDRSTQNEFAMAAPADDTVCAFLECDRQAVGWLPSGYFACSTHATQIGVALIPFQRTPSEGS